MQERVRADVVECRQLAIRDAEGRLRGTITTTDDGSVGMALNSPAEHPGLLLAVDGNGCPQVDLYDDAKRIRVGVRIDSQGSPSINVFDVRGRGRILLTVLAETHGGAPLIRLSDGTAQARIEINVPDHGAALLELHDATRRRTAALAAMPDGPAAFALFDQQGRQRCEVSVESSGVGNFILYDANGKEVFHPGGAAHERTVGGGE